MRYIVPLVILFSLIHGQTQEWVARYNGPVNVVDGGTSVAVDLLGNVYVTGRRGDTPASFECTTIKYDPAGNEKWVRAYRASDSTHYDTGWGIAIDDFGYVYVTAASTDSFTGDDIAVIKYDTLGNFIWDACYNGPGDDYDWPFDIEVDGASNVYVTGRSVGAGTGFDYVTIKYNSNGDTLWTRRYNGPANDDDTPEEIVYDGRGNIYITGDSWGGSGTRTDYCTIKYDSSGNEIWVERYDGPVHQNDQTRAIAVDIRGNVYVTGVSRGSVDDDYASVVYDSLGTEITTQRYNGPGTWADAAQDIIADTHGNFYITGFSGGSSTTYDFATIKYSGIPGIEYSLSSNIVSHNLVPNIFTGPLLLPEGRMCKVFDITGRVVMPDNIKPGIYFIEIDGKLSKKVIKVK